MEYITDAESDLLLLQNHAQEYYDVKASRQKRKLDALETYMQENFPNKPLLSLENLQLQLSIIQKASQNANLSSSGLNFQAAIEKIQSDIDNGLYYLEGSPEHQYHLDYESAKNNFVWPTPSEIELQDQEKQQLLGLL